MRWVAAIRWELSLSNSRTTILSGGLVVLPDREPTICDVAVRAGRILAIGNIPTADGPVERIDMRGLAILPGAIDPHLHLGHGKDISRPRVPADADQETAAAAIGGVTSFIPYLMSTETYDQVFEEVRAVTEAGSRIDFGYHFVISTEAQLAGVAEYAGQLGVPSFKIFMNNRGGEGTRLGLPDIDDGYLFRLCEAAASVNGVVCPHPETIEIAWVLRNREKLRDPDGSGGLRTWNASRPDFVEADAVQRAAYLARVTGSNIHIVHTSSAQALEAALMHRRAGAKITIETCPHYLTHDEEWGHGNIGKINPPLRSPADREALWRAIGEGHVDIIGTDHIHRDVASKAGSVWDASPGCPGLETMLPVMLSDGHHARGISLSRIAALTAGNSARAMGLSDRKGTIAVGLDADFAIVDLAAEWKLNLSMLRSAAGYSLYDGRHFKGRVVHTMLRGDFILRDGQLIETAIGKGRYLPRAFSAKA
jgi:dihydroorotase-like cyclic amidohydrolase